MKDGTGLYALLLLGFATGSARAQSAPPPPIALLESGKGAADPGPAGDHVPAAPTEARRAADRLFPSRNHVNLTAATGFPFVAIGEVAYGFSDRFALGAVGGVSPSEFGLGLRGRGIVFDSGPLRGQLVVPVLFYPKSAHSKDEAWALTNPTAQLDWRMPGTWRMHAGMGLILASCMDSLLGRSEESEFMGGIWNTLNGGFAIPVASKVSLAGDASFVMSGYKPAGHDWNAIGGAPIAAQFGVVGEL